MKRSVIFFLACISPFAVAGQTVLSLDSAVAAALRTHPQIQFSEQEVRRQKALNKGSFSLENPAIGLEAPYGKKFETGIQQNFDNPLVYIQQSKAGKQNVLLAENGLTLSKTQLVREVKNAYLNLQFAETKVKQLFSQDSIFNNLNLASEKRFNAGDANLLEKVSAEAKANEVHNLYMQAKGDLLNAQLQLRILTGIKDNNIQTNRALEKLTANYSSLILGDTSVFKTSPFLQYYQQNILVNRQVLKVQRSKLIPGFSIGYLNQVGAEQPEKYRFKYGITIPLWFWTYHSQIKGATYLYQMAQSQFSIAQKTINSEYQQAINDYKKYFASLNYYETSGLKQAETIISTAARSYEAGEIGYVIYMQSLNQAFEIKMNYYETLRNYNQSVIQLTYLSGK